jgi:hypothetical protein
VQLEQFVQGGDVKEIPVERPFHPTRAVARVLFWLGGVLTGVALVQGAVLPLGAAFLGSVAALQVLRGCDEVSVSAIRDQPSAVSRRSASLG